MVLDFLWKSPCADLKSRRLVVDLREQKDKVLSNQC